MIDGCSLPTREVLVVRLQRRKCITTEWYDIEDTDDIWSIDKHWFNGRRRAYQRPYGASVNGLMCINPADLAELIVMVGTGGTWEAPTEETR